MLQIHVSNAYDISVVLFVGMLALLFFLTQLNKKNVKNENTLNPLPNQYPRFYIRLYTLILVILINLGLFYYTNNENIILMSITAAIYVILLISFSTYASCKYNFPV